MESNRAMRQLMSSRCVMRSIPHAVYQIEIGRVAVDGREHGNAVAHVNCSARCKGLTEELGNRLAERNAPLSGKQAYFSQHFRIEI